MIQPTQPVVILYGSCNIEHENPLARKPAHTDWVAVYRGQEGRNGLQEKRATGKTGHMKNGLQEKQATGKTDMATNKPTETSSHVTNNV